jgi:hypothetical protein
MGVCLSGRPMPSAAFFRSPHRTVKYWISVLICASGFSGVAWAGDLINISTRGFVGTGDQVLIGGFVVAGDTPAQVIIRAPGPSLAQVNPPVAGVLADPQLQLFSGQNVIAANDNWRDSPNAAAIEAAGLAPSDDREPAILIEDLAPGPYTAIVSGVGGTTGVALVEVYH